VERSSEFRPAPAGPPLTGSGGPRISVARLRGWILLFLFLSTTINYIDRQALSVLLPTLRSELGLSSAAYGTITTMFLLAYTVVQVPGGMWIDKVGTRLGFAVSIVGWSIAAVLHAFVTGPLTLGLVRAILGATEAGNWPAGTKAVASWFPQKRRAFAMAVFDSGSAIGAVLAPPLVALLALHYGWRAAFVVTGVMGFAWLGGWLWLYHAPHEHPWLSAEQRAALAAEVGPPVTRRAPFGEALRRIAGERQLWGLMLTRLMATPVWWFYVFWLPDYLSKGRGFSLKEIGFYGWIPYLTVDLGKIAGGMASDALLARGRSATFARKSLMLLGALAMLGGIEVVNAPDAMTAVAWVCLATFGFGIWSANILALHADVFPAETMATAMGSTLMAASLSGAAFTFGVGQIVDRAGYSPVFWSVAVLPLAACFALFFVMGRIERIRSA
jgi:MFS transporter, ACS family, hexuronate transporter